MVFKLFYIKVVCNINGYVSKVVIKLVFNGKFVDLVEGNGEYLIDYLCRYLFLLFGYVVMLVYDVVDGVLKFNGDGVYIGKEFVDYLFGY